MPQYVLTEPAQRKFALEAALQLFSERGYRLTAFPVIERRAQRLANDRAEQVAAAIADEPAASPESKAEQPTEPPIVEFDVDTGGELVWTRIEPHEEPASGGPRIELCRLFPNVELLIFEYLKVEYQRVACECINELLYGVESCDENNDALRRGDWREGPCSALVKRLLTCFFTRLVHSLCRQRDFGFQALFDLFATTSLNMENWEAHREDFWASAMYDADARGGRILSFLESEGLIPELGVQAGQVREWMWTYWLLILVRWHTDRSRGHALTSDFVAGSVGVASGYIAAGLYLEIEALQSVTNRQSPMRWLKQATAVHLPWPLDRFADELNEEIDLALRRFGGADVKHGLVRGIMGSPAAAAAYGHDLQGD